MSEGDLFQIGGMISRASFLGGTKVTIADYRSMLLVLALMVWNGFEYSLKAEKQ